MAAAFLLFFCAPTHVSGENGETSPEDQRLAGFVTEIKADSLGPYDGVYWLCDDGSVRPGDEPCDSIGGIRHGLPKNFVDEIGRHRGIYIGQILNATQYEVFLDYDRIFSRAKQYQVEKYLREVDDGWIMRTARFTPGLVDSVAEAQWGLGFMSSLCERDDMISKHYFVVREFARDIPHDRPSEPRTEADSLTGPPQESLERYLALTPEGTTVWNGLNTLIETQPSPAESSAIIGGILFDIRENILTVEPAWRLNAIDLSLYLEEILIERAAQWRPKTVVEALNKNYTLARALTGCGYIGLWEWGKISPSLAVDDDGMSRAPIPIDSYSAAARRAFDGGTAMFAAHYRTVEDLFSGFEPLAAGFINHRMRSTLLEEMSVAVGETQLYLAGLTAPDNKALADSIQSHFRGMSPGVTGGVLRFAAVTDTIVSFSADTIYVLPRLPDARAASAYMSPDSVRAGSFVWPHASALRFPVSIVSTGAFAVIDSANGTAMFYAVSPQGRVVFKPAADATEDESRLIGVSVPDIDDNMIRTDGIDLDETNCIPMTSIAAMGFGRVCGDRASAIGVLSTRFPDAVPKGFVIPFGVFRDHFDQSQPGTDRTYWDFVEETFEKAREWREDGELESVIDHIVLLRFAQLREMLQSMPLTPEFRSNLSTTFAQVFEMPIGTAPVNLVTHTNASGLEAVMDFNNPIHYNLTSESTIHRAILDAWASVFLDASYHARQRQLNDPEKLYASILIQRAINFEKSGVIITTGLVNSEPEDITVSIGWGVANDDHSRETSLLKADGTDVLLSPVRQLEYSVLSAGGGLGVGYTREMNEMTGTTGRLAFRHLVSVVRSELRRFTGSSTHSPVVLDLGFDGDNAWIVGIRPLATERRAARTAYLSNLDSNSWIDLDVQPDAPFPGPQDN